MILILQIVLAILLAYLIIVFFPVVLAIGATLVGLIIVISILAILIIASYFFFTQTDTSWLSDIAFNILGIALILAIIFSIFVVIAGIFAGTIDYFQKARKWEYIKFVIWLSALIFFIIMIKNEGYAFYQQYPKLLA
jgi:hypothetical protein